MKFLYDGYSINQFKQLSQEICCMKLCRSVIQDHISEDDTRRLELSKLGQIASIIYVLFTSVPHL